MSAAAGREPSSISPQQRELLARADLLLLISDLFSPPSEGDEHRPLLPSIQQTHELVSTALPDDPQILDLMLIVLKTAGVHSRQAWSDEYHRLFEGPLLCPINETAYVRRDKGAILGDICGFYKAFGFAAASDAGAPGEKPDHLRSELEFMAVLLLMFGRCAEDAGSDAHAVTRAALSDFAAEHLGEWLPSFCMRLQNVANSLYFTQLAEVLYQVWNAIGKAMGWALATNSPVLAPLGDVEDSPMDCGVDQGSQTQPGLCELTVGGQSGPRT
jgi:putative dimethyl sulfoxide reductase chaperone